MAREASSERCGRDQTGNKKKPALRAGNSYHRNTHLPGNQSANLLTDVFLRSSCNLAHRWMDWPLVGYLALLQTAVVMHFGHNVNKRAC